MVLMLFFKNNQKATLARTGGSCDALQRAVD